jgi:hypothetical protein
MHTKLSAVAAHYLAVVTLAGVASAGPVATPQRFAVTSQRGAADAFVLTPLTSAPAARFGSFVRVLLEPSFHPTRRPVNRDRRSAEDVHG